MYDISTAEKGKRMVYLYKLFINGNKLSEKEITDIMREEFSDLSLRTIQRDIQDLCEVEPAIMKIREGRNAYWKIDRRASMVKQTFRITPSELLSFHILKAHLKSFDKKCHNNIMCFLTSERTVLSKNERNVEVKFITWRDIQHVLSEIKFSKKDPEWKVVNDFLKFYERRIKMRDLKEVLIQDVKEQTEIIRFRENRVYRRPETFGIPLYFAPHFNR